MQTRKAYTSHWISALLLGITLLAPDVVDADTFDQSHQKFEHILKQFVEDGLVDYSGLLANRGELDEYIEDVAAVSLKHFQSWTKDQQLAFLINVYNAYTLTLILDHYPLKSIKDIGGLLSKPWDLKIVSLFGKVTTLNAVEHKMIRKNYDEPCIHFALVCAARGCPPLRDESYQGSKLNEQLEEQVEVFLSDRDKNSVDLENRTLYLSPIFKWYKEDFEEGSRSVAVFVSRYFQGDAARRIRTEKFKIHYTDYDWSLNNQ